MHLGVKASPRCIGSNLAKLRQKFPQKHIVWPPSCTDDEEWWDPQGNYSNSEKTATHPDGTRILSCTERLQRFKELVLASGEGSVAVVTHPNVLAAFAGSLDMPRCRPFTCVLGYGGYAEMATTQPVVETVPTNLMQVSQYAETAVVVLGLGGESGGIEARIHEGVRLMQVCLGTHTTQNVCENYRSYPL